MSKPNLYLNLKLGKANPRGNPNYLNSSNERKRRLEEGLYRQRNIDRASYEKQHGENSYPGVREPEYGYLTANQRRPAFNKYLNNMLGKNRTYKNNNNLMAARKINKARAIHEGWRGYVRDNNKRGNYRSWLPTRKAKSNTNKTRRSRR